MAFVNMSGGQMTQVFDRAKLSGKVVQLEEQLKQIQDQARGQRGANPALEQQRSQIEADLKLAKQQLALIDSKQAEYQSKVKSSIDLAFRGIEGGETGHAEKTVSSVPEPVRVPLRSVGPDDPSILPISVGLIVVVAMIIAVLVFRRGRSGKAPRSLTQEAPSAPKTQFTGEPPPDPPPFPQIFLSYRRNDVADAAGRLFDHLAARYGRKAIFKDVDCIPLGEDFRNHIFQAVQNSSVFLAVVGPNWIRHKEDHEEAEPEVDYVQTEIEAAIQHGIPVLPVLIGNTLMPKPSELAAALKPLAYRQSAKLRGDPDFQADLARIFESVDRLSRQPRVPV